MHLWPTGRCLVVRWSCVWVCLCVKCSSMDNSTFVGRRRLTAWADIYHHYFHHATMCVKANGKCITISTLSHRPPCIKRDEKTESKIEYWKIAYLPLWELRLVCMVAIPLNIATKTTKGEMISWRNRFVTQRRTHSLYQKTQKEKLKREQFSESDDRN